MQDNISSLVPQLPWKALMLCPEARCDWGRRTQQPFTSFTQARPPPWPVSSPTTFHPKTTHCTNTKLSCSQLPGSSIICLSNLLIKYIPTPEKHHCTWPFYAHATFLSSSVQGKCCMFSFTTDRGQISKLNTNSQQWPSLPATVLSWPWLSHIAKMGWPGKHGSSSTRLFFHMWEQEKNAQTFAG